MIGVRIRRAGRIKIQRSNLWISFPVEPVSSRCTGDQLSCPKRIVRPRLYERLTSSYYLGTLSLPARFSPTLPICYFKTKQSAFRPFVRSLAFEKFLEEKISLTANPILSNSTELGKMETRRKVISIETNRTCVTRDCNNNHD